MIKRFRSYILELMEQLEGPTLDEVILTEDGSTFELLKEGNIIRRGRFGRNIRIDQPNHGVGQAHAHVIGRKGKETVVVNIDGTGSHGTKGRLHPKDADALRARGFNIRPDNIVEWLPYEDQGVQFLLE
jgi:hypothetical protein